MALNKFEITILKKLFLISILIALSIGLPILLDSEYAILMSICSFLFVCIAIYQLFKYVTKTNEKLTSFLESIKYADFSIKFTTDASLGNSFSNLNNSFNTVIEAFQKERAEKLEHLQYLNTVVRHVNVGLIAFDPENGAVEVINKHAKSLLGVFFLKNIDELETTNQNLFTTIINLKPGKSKSLILNTNTHLAIFATVLKLSRRTVKIIAIQNIHKELLSKEVDSWQKLASVLRHEIMNSITPITSINSTLLNVVNEDFHSEGTNHHKVNNESFSDLKEGLTIINDRTIALVKFVNAYRSYTSIPSPKFHNLNIDKLLNKVLSLMKIELKTKNIELNYSILSEEDIHIKGDSELLEMVIINLLKNAIEAVKDVDDPKIFIQSGIDSNQNPFIHVEDNGSGISPEAIEKIFIPFFTTKSEGSGIGLSLSSQIMEMHNGSLTVTSPDDSEENTSFKMQFYKN